MKQFKKLIAACIAAITTMSVSAFTVSADEVEIINGEKPESAIVIETYDDGFSLVSQEEFTDEDDVTYKVCLYKRDEGIATASANASGTASYKAILDAGISVHGVGFVPWVRLELRAKFTWNGVDNVTVTTIDSPIEPERLSDGFTFTESPKYELLSNQGSNFLFGNMYAIAKWDVTMTNGFNNNRKNFHLYIDVNVKGQEHVDPRGTPLIPLDE